jgi:hypothetical protein
MSVMSDNPRFFKAIKQNDSSYKIEEIPQLPTKPRLKISDSITRVTSTGSVITPSNASSTASSEASSTASSNASSKASSKAPTTFGSTDPNSLESDMKTETQSPNLKKKVEQNEDFSNLSVNAYTPLPKNDKTINELLEVDSSEQKWNVQQLREKYKKIIDTKDVVNESKQEEYDKLKNTYEEILTNERLTSANYNEVSKAFNEFVEGVKKLRSYSGGLSHKLHVKRLNHKKYTKRHIKEKGKEKEKKGKRKTHKK